MNTRFPTTASGDSTDVLDHAGEFVEVVLKRTPQLYAEMLESTRFRQILQQAPAFNAGKLFAYAEFCVFRNEFTERFPGAGEQACVNAFSRLFLKNDISVTNLVRALESESSTDLLYLSGARNPAQDSEA